MASKMDQATRGEELGAESGVGGERKERVKREPERAGLK